MSEEKSALMTGGCQCGAVRYRFQAVASGAHICHCRMCQKAGGGPFMASVLTAGFEVTRGRLSTFRSSDIAERGFCAACGTPLTYRSLVSDVLIVTLGSLDDPNRTPPLSQYGMESRVDWLDEALKSPANSLADWFKRKGITSLGNRQHPDQEIADRNDGNGQTGWDHCLSGRDNDLGQTEPVLSDP